MSGNFKTEAINISEYGDAEVLNLKEVSLPEPSQGQVRLELKAAGVNYIDIYQRSGRYQVPLPYTLGLEGAGVIDKVGPGVDEFKPGDRVAFVGQPGAYARHSILNAEKLIPLPDNLSFEEGAAFPLQGMTAQYLINEYVEIKPDMTVLIHAAAGGMGTLLCQWASHLGAHVIGTVSSEEKAKKALANGCSETINYTEKNFPEEVKRITGNSLCELIIDGVGKSTFPGDLEAISSRGTIILFGSASGRAEPVSPNQFQQKSIRVCGGSLFDYLLTKEELLTRAKDVLFGLKSGWLNLHINHKFDLQQTKDAHNLLESRKSTGKIVLVVD